MSQQEDSSSSLLSLSIAAANAQPIHIPTSNSMVNKHHRRLSSTGKTRRRLSDARDAANRPNSTASAALSLASLSLSSSPPSVPHHTSTSLVSASNVLAHDLSSPPTIPQFLKPEAVDQASNGNPKSPTMAAAKPIPIANGKNKKRGTDHKCETCSKIYRHPSCLIKHRWEHTPHWREASKFVLSKHQQVQLLEAAAILSHLSPSENSLPDDRSLWPSFLSGGSLPPPENTSLTSFSPTAYSNHHESSSYNSSYSPRQANSVPTLGTNYYRSSSSSYPNSSSGGPKLHDYPLPNSHGISGNVTQVRPGLVGVPNPNDSPISARSSIPSPVNLVLPKPTLTSSSLVPLLSEEEENSFNAQRDYNSLASPDQERFHSRSISIHSGSRSRSGSASVSDDDEMSPYTDQEKSWGGFHGRRYANVEDVEPESTWNGSYGSRTRGMPKNDGHTRESVKEEWDGMEMEMEMD